MTLRLPAGPSAEDVLRAFIKEMHDWEVEARDACELAIALDRAGSDHPSTLAKMNRIFDLYCTPKPRPFGRQGSFRHPPEYDPDSEEIVGISQPTSRRVEILTRNQRTKQDAKYVLLKKTGRWLLDSKRIRPSGCPWMKWHL
jgi:hypothetical protein